MSSSSSYTSGSSSDNESAHQEETGSTHQQSEDESSLRFNCPQNYTEIPFGRAESLFIEELSNKKLWLIQAPRNFNVKKLNGHKVNLTGSQILISPGNEPTFEVNFSQTECKDWNLLIPSKNDNKLHKAPDFQGHMKIVETVAVPPLRKPQQCPSSQVPRVDVDNLKHRLLPFGWKEPKERKTSKKRKHKVKKSKVIQEENLQLNSPPKKKRKKGISI